MPIRVTDLISDQRECSMEYNGEKAGLVYRPSAYTPEVEEFMQEMVAKQMPGVGIAKLLSAVLIDWEVVNDDESKISFEEEDLRVLPVTFLTAVLNAITADMRAGDEEDLKNSEGGSLARTQRRPKRRSTGMR